MMHQMLNLMLPKMGRFIGSSDSSKEDEYKFCIWKKHISADNGYIILCENKAPFQNVP